MSNAAFPFISVHRQFAWLRPPGLVPLASSLWPCHSGLVTLSSSHWPRPSCLVYLASYFWPLVSSLWPRLSSLLRQSQRQEARDSKPEGRGHGDMMPYWRGQRNEARETEPDERDPIGEARDSRHVSQASFLWPRVFGLVSLASCFWPCPSGLVLLVLSLWPRAAGLVSLASPLWHRPSGRVHWPRISLRLSELMFTYEYTT